MTALSRPVVASLGVCLAFVAGSVDATGLAAVGRFTSHMTGTTTHVMTDLVAARARLAGLGLSVLASFLCGTILCGAILASRPKPVVMTTLAIVIGIEAIGIGIGGIVLQDPATARWAPLAIGLFAFAMGMQNATSSHLLAPYRRTTHMTSTLTDLGSEIGVRLRAALGRTVAEPLAAPDADILSNSTLVFVGFCIGGIVGAANVATTGVVTAPVLAVVPALAASLLGWFGRHAPA